MNTQKPNPDLLWPSATSPHVVRFFQWWMGKMFRKDFNTIRAIKGTTEILSDLDQHQGPVLVLMNHQCWWDPLIGMYIARHLTPARSMLAPMELAMLRKFPILRKLGVFGLNPDAPQSLEIMIDHVTQVFQKTPRTSFWITPQGQFADVRTPVRLRPGAAAVAARTPGVKVVCLAVEMAFWLDRKPEILLRFEPCEPPPAPTTAGWNRVMTQSMQRNADELSKAVIARAEADFAPIARVHAGRAVRVNPLYDLWLRLRGRSAELRATDREQARVARPRAHEPAHETEKPADLHATTAERTA